MRFNKRNLMGKRDRHTHREVKVIEIEKNEWMGDARDFQIIEGWM